MLETQLPATLLPRPPAAVRLAAATIFLTRKGRALIDRAFTEHMANEHRLLAALSPGQADELEKLLTGWLAHYEQPPS